MEAEFSVEAAKRTPLIRQLCQYLSERSPQPMVAVEGLTHVVIYANPAFAQLVGKSSNDLVGRSFCEAVPEGSSNGCLALLDRVFQSGKPEILAEQEHTQVRPEPVYWSYSVWAILGDDQRPVGVMIQVTDSTETSVFRRQAVAMNEALVLSSVRQHELIGEIEQAEKARHDLEVQMFHTQKVESLGVLAGGIAHDLNNILTPILGFSELARESLPKDSSVGPMLDQVAANTRRAADLVQQILAYSGKGRFNVQPVEVSNLLREMGGLITVAVATRAELLYELAPELPVVEADAMQLRQLVMNLVINAAEAIDKKGGRISIRTSAISVAENTIWSARLKDHLPEGVYVALDVTDTGSGIAPDVVEKIFDPFFTTKFLGRGLGLAAALGIAHAHRGIIQVSSELGRGSSFRLLLPGKPTSKTGSVAVIPRVEWRGRGTILLIDDEDSVRKIATLILNKAGFSVLAAGDGQAGLELFQQQAQSIEAVVLDLTMPGKGGLEVAVALREVSPNLPIVLMSGFCLKEVELLTVGLSNLGFVQKPYSTAELLSAIRRVLGQ